MLTNSETSATSPRRAHRTYTAQFKAELVAACQQHGASIAALVGQHAMEANVLHRWLKEHERSGCHQLLGHRLTGALKRACCRVHARAVASSRATAPGPGDQGRAAPGHAVDGGDLARERGSRMCELGGDDSQMIRIDTVWLATEPMDYA